MLQPQFVALQNFMKSEIPDWRIKCRLTKVLKRLFNDFVKNSFTKTCTGWAAVSYLDF